MTWIALGDAAATVVGHAQVVRELQRAAELEESPSTRFNLTMACDVIDGLQVLVEEKDREISELRRQLTDAHVRAAQDREWAAV